MNTITLDWQKYSDLARAAAAEGCVLLRNEQDALPVVSGETAAVFGRIQLDYYKSGTGSGGMVNVLYVHSILDGLAQYPSVHIYEPLLSRYRTWAESHPFNCGSGWGTEPWCQEEMELSEEIVADAASHADIALIIIGRTAGEDRDNTPLAGSYYLTDGEKDMLSKVCAKFRRTAVILNTGNTIDMNWVEEYNPSAVLYVWQGGMEGGFGAADVICGAVSPSGKLSDTIARNLSDYPSVRNFGSDTENIYQEDIYVGYRYFETFAPECVQYPFGFGLSYTTFSVSAKLQKNKHFETVWKDCSASADRRLSSDDNRIICTIAASVTNTGSAAGKEVVQVYACPPQGTLGKPVRNLVGFAKTDLLEPGETQELTIRISADHLASFDDSGVTGHRSCFVLECGEYGIYTGTDVRSAALTDTFIIEETLVISQHQEAMAPVKAFERFRPVKSGPAQAAALSDEAVQNAALSDDLVQNAVLSDDPVQNAALSNAPDAAKIISSPETDGTEYYKLSYETVPLRTVNPADRRLAQDLTCLPYSGDKGYRLSDVQNQNISLEIFLAQLSDADLMTIVKGEGMCSPKVTPGTAAAFGGVTDSLLHFGIPVGCCSDGPSGIRMDCGTSAFSLPNGTLLACSFNVPLVTELFEMEGLELYSNQIDALLGPGINIHRSPLNGRNFEYHSEDPYLTGRMAEAQLAGMDCWGVSGTMKHFCANNQEYCRHSANGVISERALREIYLKPFEMGVRSGCCRSVMTTYGPVNGIWTAGNFDLNTTILRNEWGFKGLVMTDWWAHINDEGGQPSRQNLAAMVRSQNDVFMVTPDAAAYEDNLQEEFAAGSLSRAELVRCAANICTFLLASPALKRITGTYIPVTHCNQPTDLTLLEDQGLEYCTVTDDTIIPLENRSTAGGSSFLLALSFEREGTYAFALTATSDASDLAQMAVTLSMDSTVLNVYSFHGSMQEPETQSRDKDVRGNTHYLKFFFSQSGLTLHSLRITHISDDIFEN